MWCGERLVSGKNMLAKLSPSLWKNVWVGNNLVKVRIPSGNTFLELLLLSYCFQGGSLQVLVYSLAFCSRKKSTYCTIHGKPGFIHKHISSAIHHVDYIHKSYPNYTLRQSVVHYLLLVMKVTVTNYFLQWMQSLAALEKKLLVTVIYYYETKATAQ